jgi:hypothetical protein
VQDCLEFGGSFQRILEGRLVHPRKKRCVEELPYSRGEFIFNRSLSLSRLRSKNQPSAGPEPYSWL